MPKGTPRKPRRRKPKRPLPAPRTPSSSAPETKAEPSGPETPPQPGHADADRGPGRPTLYRREFVDQVRRLCKVLGATEFEIAQYLGVTEVTLWRWKHEYPEFCKAMQVGKRAANRRAEERLFHRAMGYSHEDVDIRVVEGAIVQTPITKHYPPSEAALRLWLTNQDPRRWRNLISTTVETPPGKPLEHQHTYGTPELLAEFYARQAAAAAKSVPGQPGAERSGDVPQAPVSGGGEDLGAGDEGGEES